MDLLENARTRIKGPTVPMTTPISDDGHIDYDRLAELTTFYVSHGIKAVIAAGTTGYCYTLTPEEHKRVVETVVQAAGGKMYVIAGVSQSGTMLSNRLADICENAGADALLMTAPYYGIGSEEGTFRHYKTVAESHSTGMVVYNRSSEPLNVEFFKRLADVDNIIGIKDTSGDLHFGRDICVELGDRYVVMSGGGMRYFMWHWLWGAQTYAAGIANLVPEVELEFCRHLDAGDIDAARKIVVDTERPFFEIMTVYGWHESLHAAVKLFGLPAGALRLPLIEPPAEHVKKMGQVFRDLGLMT